MEQTSTQHEIACPYCGEIVQIFVEPDVHGELVQDCEVCCNPWLVRIDRDRSFIRVEAKRLDD